MRSKSEAIRNCYKSQNYLRLHDAPGSLSGIRGTSEFPSQNVNFVF